MTRRPDRPAVAARRARRRRLPHLGARAGLLLLLIVLGVVFAPLTAVAAPADLDTTWGGTGRVSTDLSGGQTDYLIEMLLQSDGKVVGVGTWKESGTQMAAVRYNSDGTLDTGFGTGGRVLVPLLNYGGGVVSQTDSVQDAILQPDGKILIAGSFYPNPGGVRHTGVVRLNTNGTLDTSFSADGYVDIDATGVGQSSEAGGVGVQSDGKIIVLSNLSDATGTDGDLGLIRLNTNGSIDTSFGGGGTGIVRYDGGSGQGADRAFNLIVQPDNTILVGGDSDVDQSLNGVDYDLLVVRFTANGALDTTFSGDGVVTIAPGVRELGQAQDSAVAFYAFARQADGKILIGGATKASPAGTTRDIALTRLNSDGSYDAGFGGNGVVITDVNGSEDVPYYLAVQANGKIVLAGGADKAGSSTTDSLIARYNADGSFDTSWNGTGKLLIDNGPSTSEGAYTITIQPDGRLLVGLSEGQTSSSQYNFYSIRLLGDAADTTPPAAPVVITPANGSITNNPTPTYTGTAEANSTVTVYVDGSSIGTTIANASGNWSRSQVTPLAQGPHTVRATATDAANNTGPNSNTNTFTVDTTSPPAPIVTGPANGSLVATQTPTYSGTAEANSTVTVYVDGSARGTTTANAAGNWAYAQPTALAQGPHAVRATATDAAGNTSTSSTTNTFTVDTVAPPAPVVVTPANGSTTSTTAPTVSGTAEANSTVTVYIDATNRGSTSADASGNWALTAPTLSPGSHTVFATARDAVGNTGPNSATNTFTVAAPPPAPVVVTPANGSVTNNPQPAVSGTAEANAAVTVLLDGSTVGTTSADASGNWSFTPSPPLNDGAHTVKATAARATGPASADSNTNTFTVDTIEPDTTFTGTPPATTNRPATTFRFTGDGTGSAVARFECSLDAAPFATCASPQNVAVLVDGAHTFQVRAIDAAGNTETTPASYTWTTDTAAPPAPVVVTPANGSTTNNRQPVISGTAEPNSTVTIVINSAAVGTTSVDGSGNWTYTPAAALADGAYTVRARAADAVGNASADSNTNTFTLDATAPPAPVIATPVNGTTTNSRSVTLLGTAESNGTVTVAFGGTSYGPVGVDASGNWSLPLPGPLADGTYTATATATDAAGNTGPGTSTTFGVDATVPTATITTTAADPTRTSPIPFTITFSEPVAGFDQADLVVTNGTVDLYTPASPTTATFVVRPAGQGVVTVSVAAGAAQDLAGNPSVAAQASITYDTVAPTVALTTTAPDPTNTSPIPVTVTFSEAVTGFDPADVQVTNGTASNVAGSGATYTFDLVPSGQGPVTVSIAADAAQDAAGNGNAAAAPLSRVYDTVAPTATINQAAGQPDPTPNSPIRFTVTFSEPVTGFDAADVALSGTAGGTLTATVSGSGTTYEVQVGGMATGGTVIAAVKPGAAADAAGNASAASTSADNTVTFQQQGVLTVTTNGPGTVSPGTGQYPYGPLTLTATPQPGALFTGWRVDGTVVGWGPTLSLTVSGPRAIEARFAARPSFADVTPSGVRWDAITQLAARGIIKGYPADECAARGLAAPCFGPGDTLVRAQMAALIVRALGWETNQPGGPAPFSDLGGVDPELQRAIAILAQRGIARGYGDGTYGPADELTHAQAISLISRSMVQAGYWTQVTAAEDDGTAYPNVTAASGHRYDLLTFAKYAGAIPDRPQGQAWQDWQTPASRGWTAQVLWQALDSYYRVNRAP